MGEDNHNKLKLSEFVHDILTSVGSSVTALVSERTADTASGAAERYKAREKSNRNSK